MIAKINKSNYPKYTEINNGSSEENRIIGKAPKNEDKSRKNYFIKNQFVFEKLYLNLNDKKNINIDEIKDNLNTQKSIIPKKDYEYNNFLKTKENEVNEINEQLIPGSKMISLNPILDIYKSICKIKSLGSGFLIKLQKRDEDFFCLMTNEHVITKNMIENENKIEVYYDNEKKKFKIKLNPNERIIETFTYLDIDLSVVEILSKDGISEEFFLLPSIDYMKDFDKLINKNITIIQYPNEKFFLSNGKIENINCFEFSHSASTDYGSSGSPIFLEGTTKVIGIHKSRVPTMPLNKGNFIGPIYRYFKELPKYKYKSDKKIFDNDHNGTKKIKLLIKKDFCFNDGRYYIGEMKNGLPNGKGIEYYEDGNIKYEGEFINGKREGHGKFYYLDGDYYIGKWKDNKRHGKGALYKKNGNISYKGDFENGFFIFPKQGLK